MWFLKNSPNVQEIPPLANTHAPIQRPVGRTSTEQVRVPVEYGKVADALGYHPTALWREQFTLYLLEHNQPIFSFIDVKAYLDHIRLPDKQVVWCPLTIADWMVAKEILHCDCTNTVHSEDSLNLSFSKIPYTRLIPLEVLERILCIRKEFSVQQVPMFVSDFAVVKPDPFLLTFFDSTAIVFDAWDEPGFGILGEQG